MTITQILMRSSWRFFKRHPAQLLLSITGIILGVAIVTAVLITNNSSQKAFALSSEALYGRTTHQITGAQGINEHVYVSLKQKRPDITMAPVIQDHVVIDTTVYSILGLDPFTEAAFERSSSPFQAMKPSSTVGGDSLLASEFSINEDGLTIGETVELNVGGRQHVAMIAGALKTSNPVASSGLLVGDIAFVQSLLARKDTIDRIDLILTNDQALSLEKLLPANLVLNAALSRQQTMLAMTRGFHINLTAMSLLALLVGAFLIHNTMTFAVVQRREVFAIKRITGIDANTIFKSILIEAVIISTFGSILGVIAGYVLAHFLIQLTTQTINDLYFVLHVQEIWFDPWIIFAGLLLGIGSSLIAAMLSAFDAASSHPIQARQRSAIEQRTKSLLPWLAMAGLTLVIAGFVLANAPLDSLLAGFLALMTLIIGYGMILPWFIQLLSRSLQIVVAQSGISLSFALAGIERNISRTGLAIAALCIAVSATFGVDIMIGSFRNSVDQWLGKTLQSDVYVSAPSAASSQNSPRLSPILAVKARKIQGVRSVSTGLSFSTSTNVGNIELLVVKPHTKEDPGFELIQSHLKLPWAAWQAPTTVMISEPLATKHKLASGDFLAILTELGGKQAFKIAAIFRDYESSHGKILMSRSNYTEFWTANDISTLGIMLNNQAQEKVVIAEIKKSMSTRAAPLIVRSNTSIHQESLAVFDRTFEVTRVLRWLTVAVAFVGIFSALLALHLERAREFAILRATGATQFQIMVIVVGQTFFMGLFAGALALPLGWVMSEVLINVINVQSFGWTMSSILPPGSIRSTLLLAIASAILAGLYPAFRLSRSNIAKQLRDD
ncbi:MAG: putative ABC transport system permease protein [Granulosicoccus sp.]|jgi:putative ABC transport system permease protein